MVEADILILGGGCAGLSLAMRLAELGDLAPRTVIFEARTQYVNDRTWCFWENNAGSMAFTTALVTKRWSRMRIKTGSSQVIADCSTAPYSLLPSIIFYNYVRSIISRSANVTLRTGMPVSDISQLESSRWRVTAGGKQYTGKTVIDTRPATKPQCHPSMLWQSFSGVEIECKASVFDASFVDLMDFHHADPTRVVFTYVLPTSPNRALIEATIFAPNPVSQADLKLDLERAISSRVGTAAYKILDAEHGILPMGQPLEGQSRHIQFKTASYVTVGLGAGAARASTGYAFQRIQLWAEACAQAFVQGKQPQGHIRDRWRLSAMDSLFLRVIKDHPSRAPQLFLSLFEKADTTSVIRFLSDGGTVADALAVIRAMPSLPFLKAGLVAMGEAIPARIATFAAALRRQQAQ
jgi:lycopene beta-cyclase